MKDLSDTLVFLGEIKKGKLELAAPAFFRTRISKQPDCKVHIIVQKPKNRRSISQNNLYWLYLDRIARETGNDDRYALHEDFKTRFLFRGTRYTLIKGVRREVKLYGSTADLNKNDFAEYILSIEADTGVAIPDAEAWKMQGLDINLYYPKYKI